LEDRAGLPPLTPHALAASIPFIVLSLSPFTADSVRLYQISPLFHGNKVKHPVIVFKGATIPGFLRLNLA